MTQPDTRDPHPPCTGCGVVDDHPRHIVINSLTDDSLNTNMHLHCCVGDGACSSCQKVVDVAGDDRGLDLLPHIERVHGESTDLNEGVEPVSDFVLNRKG